MNRSWIVCLQVNRAKKEILGMSEEEIRNDLEQQRLEKAAAAEMEQTSEIIKKTGIFDRVDRLYGDFDALVSGAGGADAGAGGADDGGLGGGADDGGLGGGADAGGLGGAESESADAGSPAPTEESTNKKDNLLLETKKRNYEEKVKRYQGMYLRRLTESLEKDENISD